MRRLPCTLMLITLVVVVPVLAGCSDFDPDKLDVFGINEKKKLPGDRKELFPGGVPGVTQGVPPEYMKGYQPTPETADATLQPPPAGSAAAGEPNKTAAVEPAEEAKPKPTARHKPKPRTASRPPAQAPAQAEQQKMAPWPDQQPQQHQAQQSPWPAPQQQQPAQQAQQSPWPAPQQQAPAPWPSAPPPGTFSKQ